MQHKAPAHQVMLHVLANLSLRSGELLARIDHMQAKNNRVGVESLCELREEHTLTTSRLCSFIPEKHPTGTAQGWCIPLHFSILIDSWA